MPETGKIILDNMSAMVTYTSNYQVFEIYETNTVSREFLSHLHIGKTLVLEEVDGRQLKLVITDMTIGQAGKCKAIIKK
jgi:hypothetical protein